MDNGRISKSGMNKNEVNRAPRPVLRRTVLKTTSALPVLVTLLNGTAGFAAIHYATKAGLDGAGGFHNVMIAAWMIFAALLFDALDGRLARMTRQATDFGAQLDSLCDIISFGVAPAVLMVHTASLTRQIPDFEFIEPHASNLGKVVMVIAVIYVCCAALRLARFTVENAPDLLHHLHFTGLPSPAAAVLVASMVLLFGHIQGPHGSARMMKWLNITVGVALPSLTFVTSLLMVSRFRYPHLVNRFVIGKKPFGHVVVIVIGLIIGLVFLMYALPTATLIYAASGPVGALWGRFKTRKARRCSDDKRADYSSSST